MKLYFSFRRVGRVNPELYHLCYEPKHASREAAIRSLRGRPEIEVYIHQTAKWEVWRIKLVEFYPEIENDRQAREFYARMNRLYNNNANGGTDQYGNMLAVILNNLEEDYPALTDYQTYFHIQGPKYLYDEESYRYYRPS